MFDQTAFALVIIERLVKFNWDGRRRFDLKESLFNQLVNVFFFIFLI